MKYQYDLFLSHSSKDKPAVRSLADRLQADGYHVWLDERKINAGDSIVDKVFDGLEYSRYVGIWLTAESLASNWVATEYKSKYHYGISENMTVLIPMLGERCKVPFAIGHLKYADFSASFDDGYTYLLDVLKSSSAMIIEQMKTNILNGDFPELSAKRLMDLVILRRDENALNALQEGLDQTQKLGDVLDHCAWAVGNIVCNSTHPDIVNTALGYVTASVHSNSDTTVDKFAYVAAHIYKRVGDPVIRQTIYDFISAQSQSSNPIVRDHYLFTLNHL